MNPGVFLRMGALGGRSFNPTIAGRIAADGNVVSTDADDYVLGPGSSGADSISAIWAITDASNAYIRVGATAFGNSSSDESWFDDNGVDQGAPGAETGAGTTVFTLGERPDSINIYTVETDGPNTAPVFSAYGSYTDDDKTTFFNPTNATKYGKEIDAGNSTTSGVINTGPGNFTIQVTFRKAGYQDYTITFKAESSSQIEVD